MSLKNNISNPEEDDLNEMAPLLWHIGNKSPFKADPDYFDSFSSKLESRISGFEEIKTEAPLLSNIPFYNPFETPADYFDELPTKIQKTINQKNTKPSILDWLILFIKPNVAIPVLTTLLIAYGAINYLEKQGEVTKPKTDYQLSEEEELYLIDESTIIEALVTVSGQENKNAIEPNTGIENYLIENNMDEINLSNEL